MRRPLFTLAVFGIAALPVSAAIITFAGVDANATTQRDAFRTQLGGGAPRAGRHHRRCPTRRDPLGGDSPHDGPVRVGSPPDR